ncbi:MAG: hypothetical protein MZV63_52870 [Marinilabiliales bacterium]|nr:hypothetical protein [Marinilabiliales bacterium]
MWLRHADQAKLVAEELQKKFGTEIFVIKAQIHAGGRGKGGGVKIARSPQRQRRWPRACWG